MAKLIKTDGTISEFELLGHPTPFDKVREAIGGYVETVRGWGCDHNHIMLVDEEGRLKNKPLNPIATVLYRGDPPHHNGIIVGDVVLAQVFNPGQDDERWE